MDKIENVVQNIIHKCSESNVACSEYLAAFVAHTTVRTDSVSFALDKEINEDGLQEVIQRSVQKIIEKDSPSMETIKMQVAYNVACILCDNEKRNKEKRKFEQMESKTLALAKKISHGCMNDNDCLLKLYDDIFLYIRELQNGENDDLKVMQQRVDEEILAAIESVFPPDGLKSFLLLSMQQKKNTLNELFHVVLGIRLFNKEFRNSKTGLVSIDKIHEEQILTLKQRIESAIETIGVKCDHYHESISREKLGRMKSNEARILRWKDELTNRRQLMTFIRNILQEIHFLTNHCTTSKNEFNSSLEHIKSLIANKKSIPKKYIFPKFERVAQLWKDMTDHHEDAQFLLYRFNDILRYENSFTETIDIPSICRGKNERKASEKSENLFHVTNANCVEQLNQIIIAEESSEIEKATSYTFCPKKDIFEYPNGNKKKPVHLSPSTMNANFENLELEYNGYCPSSIIKHNGLLVFGKPDLGLVHYQDKNYVFENKDGLNEFLENPSSIIEGVNKLATMNPELIHALRLQSEFMPHSFTTLIKKVFHVGSSSILNPSKMDASTETPLHFQETLIDPNYQWNEWVLRKDAMKAADLIQQV